MSVCLSEGVNGTSSGALLDLAPEVKLCPTCLVDKNLHSTHCRVCELLEYYYICLRVCVHSVGSWRHTVVLLWSSDLIVAGIISFNDCTNMTGGGGGGLRVED